jgi:hypothetical protein
VSGFTCCCQALFQFRAQGVHLFAVVETGQMCQSVRQQTAEMRRGSLSVKQTFPVQGIQRNTKAAPEGSSWASGIPEGQAVCRALAVEVPPVQIRDVRVTDKEKFHISPLRSQLLQDAWNQAAQFAWMQG